MTGQLTGRSGRLLLRRRLETARKAADLLDRKQRVLLEEQARFREAAERTRHGWERCAHEAALWFGRTLAVDGYDAIDRATSSGFVEVATRQASTMGVVHPAEASCTFPRSGPSHGGPTLMAAVESHRAAVEAAAQHAVTVRAFARLTEELAQTRVRQRALEHRRIPDLEADLRQLEAQLDELDREENLRMHWAADVATSA